MPTLRTGLIASAAALLAAAGTVAATQGSGNAAPATPAAPAAPAVSGIATMQGFVDLPPSTWTNIPLQVRLPYAGTYEIDADVRGRLQGTPPLNTYIIGRLWNVTSGAQVPDSQRTVYQVLNDNTASEPVGGNQTAPVSELITVTRPTTIQLQAQEVNGTGTAAIAQVASDDSGYTTLRYVRVSDLAAL
ncbi:MAG: hypothetical protein QOG28_2400 [Trebonia sp.]|nr:hypothetical protein [Trebonia sp.]